MAFFQILILFLFGLIAFPMPQRKLSDPQATIAISATPIVAFEFAHPSRQRFGLLEFRGGLVLTSSYKPFGGFSALRVQPDGARFIALSDRASWLSGRIVYNDNHPSEIANAVMAPLLDAQGKPQPKWDSESIAQDGDTLYVGLEGLNSIVRFDYGKMGLLSHGQFIPVPPEVKGLPRNQGLEAMVFVPRQFSLGGTLIAISERGLTESGNLKAFLIGGPTPGMFSVKRTDGYDISDAALLPRGDLLILERQYSLERGVAMRIRRIPLADIKPGALIDGPVIIEADLREQIDNMEALSVHRTSSGETVLTLMSDDNFSPLQRTLLLQFVLDGK